MNIEKQQKNFNLFLVYDSATQTPVPIDWINVVPTLISMYGCGDVKFADKVIQKKQEFENKYKELNK